MCRIHGKHQTYTNKHIINKCIGISLKSMFYCDHVTQSPSKNLFSVPSYMTAVINLVVNLLFFGYRYLPTNKGMLE